MKRLPSPDILRLILVDVIVPVLILVCFGMKKYDGRLEWVG